MIRRRRLPRPARTGKCSAKAKFAKRNSLSNKEIQTGAVEDGHEAALGEAMKRIAELAGVVPQYRICREDGSLISRADFAVPELKSPSMSTGPRVT